ncbi:FAD binding domain-containing protein [Defluviitalea phaphyphila]|uniref:FAD binding domain-containing protein n=1 Tax=Defluviitalea phaphyphila TaxID=1473580 RepID=UPI00072FFA92|nr:FAD binding domain-containing protein [Defluviitalea phaphyphila]
MVKGYYPKTINEVLEILSMEEEHMLICGGSDLMVTKKFAQNMIFINQIEELKEIKEDSNKIYIGAGCVYKEMIDNEIIPEVLREAIKHIASPAIRNIASIGGNICNASPAGDTLPVLYAMDAIIVKAFINKDGNLYITRVPICDFILGVRKIALEKNEMVIAIEIDKESYKNMTYSYYKKVGGRKSSAISKLSFVGLMKIENNIIKDVKMAFGAVGPTALRSREGEKILIGTKISDIEEKKEAVINFYDKLIIPIDDQRSTAKYRKKACLNLLNDFITYKN